MKITHRITICDECGLEWVKPFWEPRWLSRVAANETHDDYHRGWKDPEHHEIVESWRKWERERIIALLEAEKFHLPDGMAEGLTFMPIQEAIALIKGENE